MHDLSHLGPKIIFGIGDTIIFTETAVFAIIISVIMMAAALFSVRKLERFPKGSQFWAEFIVEKIYNMTSGILGKEKAVYYTPYIGTLFIFLLLANSTGLWGLRPVTADLNVTFAMAFITFLVLQRASIKEKGITGHLKHYVEPYPFMLPINIIEDLSLPVSMAFRLFGNIAGGMIVMALVVSALSGITGDFIIPVFLIGIPLLPNAFFDIFEPILQAFIFTMLNLAFISVKTSH